MTLPGRSSRCVRRTSSGGLNVPSSQIEMAPNYYTARTIDPNLTTTISKSSSGMIMTNPSENTSKPTDEELAALDAIRRLGNEIDTAVALEFLRGPLFGGGENSGISNTMSSSTSDRGLPSTAVSILKLWFFVHQNDPYPTKEQKESLIKETGLSMVQLKNWFSNIRKRHWHPIRTGSRRPRSHVEYVLLYGVSNSRTVASPPSSSNSVIEDEDNPAAMTVEYEQRPRKMQRGE